MKSLLCAANESGDFNVAERALSMEKLCLGSVPSEAQNIRARAQVKELRLC
jgi:hypothetical protein